MFGNGRHGKPRITGSGIGPAKKGKKIGGGFAEISGGAEVQVTIGDFAETDEELAGLAGCGVYAQRVVGGIMFEQLSGSAGLVGIAQRKQNFLVEEFFQVFF